MFLVPLYLRLRRIRLFWIVFFYLVTLALHADIVTDGTVGTAQTLTGPNFSIPETLGARAGANLFHSFQRFNIGNGEQATFTGSPDIANVISRVTGGQASTINGVLRSTIGQADFYFINPAGVLFGANAQIDVPGSFYVSTADELRFSDGFVYNAKNPSASTLSFDQPESFGFLGDQTATISVVESNLVLTPGNTLSMSGGELNIDKAQLRVDAGEVQLVAAGDAATMMTVGGELSEAGQGNLTIDDSEVDVSGNGAGRLVVRGGKGVIKASRLFADNLGSTDAGLEQDIDVRTESLVVDNSVVRVDSSGPGQGADLTFTTSGEISIVNGSEVANSALGSGNAGNVTVNARQLTIDGQKSEDPTRILNRVGIPSQDMNNNSTGNAGNILVNVDGNLSLVDSGQIISDSFGPGNAGNVVVNAGQLLIDSQGSTFATAIINTTRRDKGKAGTIIVNVDDTMSIFDGGIVFSGTFSETVGADAGSVIVNTGSLVIDTRGGRFITGIQNGTGRNTLGKSGNVEVNAKNSISMIGRASRISNSTSGAGDAGSVTVNAKDSLTVTQGEILSTTRSSGNAGNIAVNAKNLVVDGQADNAFIASQTQGDATGNAGNVTVKVEDALSLVDVAIISSSTFGKGEAGNVTVEADQLMLDGKNNPLALGIDNTRATGIFSDAEENTPGQTGNITVNASSLSVINRASISIISDPTIDSGRLATIRPTEINITAQHLNLSSDALISTESRGNIPAGSIKLNNVDTLSLDASSISTAANNANGGAITTQAKVIDLKDSQITTSVTGQGDGGDINLNAKVLVLDTGFIQANTAGAEAQGGDIIVNAKALIASGNNLLTGGNIPFTFEPFSGLNVIQAAAPDGVSGAIDVTSPQLNISGDLVGLDSAITGVEAVVYNPCAVPGVQQSVLINSGRGGLPETAQDVQSIPLNRQRLNRILSSPGGSAKPIPGSENGAINEDGVHYPPLRLARIDTPCTKH